MNLVPDRARPRARRGLPAGDCGKVPTALRRRIFLRPGTGAVRAAGCRPLRQAGRPPLQGKVRGRKEAA
jgi:hypothetical protein